MVLHSPKVESPVRKTVYDTYGYQQAPKQPLLGRLCNCNYFFFQLNYRECKSYTGHKCSIYFKKEKFGYNTLFYQRKTLFFMGASAIFQQLQDCPYSTGSCSGLPNPKAMGEGVTLLLDGGGVHLRAYYSGCNPQWAQKTQINLNMLYQISCLLNLAEDLFQIYKQGKLLCSPSNRWTFTQYFPHAAIRLKSEKKTKQHLQRFQHATTNCF